MIVIIKETAQMRIFLDFTNLYCRQDGEKDQNGEISQQQYLPQTSGAKPAAGRQPRAGDQSIVRT